MATIPDPHPDSDPAGPAEAPDQISPVEEPGREDVERPSTDSAGSPGGTGGTGGTAHENDTP